VVTSTVPARKDARRSFTRCTVHLKARAPADSWGRQHAWPNHRSGKCRWILSWRHSSLGLQSPLFSDHSLFYCRLGVPRSRTSSVSFTYRDFRRIELPSFRHNILESRLHRRRRRRDGFVFCRRLLRAIRSWDYTSCRRLRSTAHWYKTKRYSRSWRAPPSVRVVDSEGVT